VTLDLQEQGFDWNLRTHHRRRDVDEELRRRDRRHLGRLHGLLHPLVAGRRRKRESADGDAEQTHRDNHQEHLHGSASSYGARRNARRQAERHIQCQRAVGRDGPQYNVRPSGAGYCLTIRQAAPDVPSD